MKVILTESQFKNLINEITSEQIDIVATEVNTDPTRPQIDAGNYKKAHISVKGMKISIEQPKGSKRRWVDSERNISGTTTMKNHYGYFRYTNGNGKDGDAVDVFLGKHLEDFTTVYVVDQNRKDGSFDESKVMIGFLSKDSAKKAYLRNYSKDWWGFGGITAVSIPVFKKWLYRKHKQRKPFSEYVYVIKHKNN